MDHPDTIGTVCSHLLQLVGEKLLAHELIEGLLKQLLERQNVGEDWPVRRCEEWPITLKPHKDVVPSLLDPDTGELYVNTPAQRAAHLAGATLTDVERELRAQIDAVVEVGLAPTHLDWHCLADGGRADILDLTMALAKEYGLAARVWLDDGRRKARQLGKPVVDNAFLDSYSVSLHDKAATYARMLRDLPPGLNEWAVHPAHGTEEWKAIEPTGSRVRHSDTRSSPHHKHTRSSIKKASPSSTTGHCSKRGTPSRVPVTYR